MVRVRIGIGFLADFSDPDHGTIIVAVVDEGELALFARAQNISSLEVSNVIPIRALFFRKLIDRIDFGFGFQEPVLSHAVRLAKPKLCRKVKFRKLC